MPDTTRTTDHAAPGRTSWPAAPPAMSLLLVTLLSLATGARADPGTQAQVPDAAVTSATAQTAAADDNGALIKNAYDAFSRGDIDAVMASFAPDIVWHVPGRGPLSRDYRGHDEVLGFFEHFMALSGGTFRLRVDAVLAQGERVVVLCTESAQRGERKWTAPQVHVWTVQDGKATAFREYEGDEYGDDAFWSLQVTPAPGSAAAGGGAPAETAGSAASADAR